MPNENFTLVHGAGSFGHVVSSDRNLNSGLNDTNAIDFSIVARDVQELNTRIVSMKIERGIPAISMPIHSFHIFGENFSLYCPETIDYKKPIPKYGSSKAEQTLALYYQSENKRKGLQADCKGSKNKRINSEKSMDPLVKLWRTNRNQKEW